MREIKFRGFDTKNNKWEIGYLAKASGHIIIVADLNWTNGVKFVSEETVGQFTGLHDKNGKEIYEGDVIKNNEGRLATIEYEETSFMAIGEFIPPSKWKDCEVMGNIYENKNLLGGN